jgi:hypothetical protein
VNETAMRIAVMLIMENEEREIKGRDSSSRRRKARKEVPRKEGNNETIRSAVRL